MSRGPDRDGNAKGRYAETLTEFLMNETVEERELRRARFDRFLVEHRQWVDSHPVVRMAERQCDELMRSVFIGGQFNVTGQLHSVFKTMETMKELIAQKKKELIYIQTNYETQIKGLERELMSARLKIERDIVHKNEDGPCPYDPTKLTQMRALLEERNPGSFPSSALNPPAPCDNLSGDNNSEPGNLCETDCSPENDSENIQEEPEMCCQSCGFSLYTGSEFCSRCGRPVEVESSYNETMDCSFESDETESEPGDPCDGTMDCSLKNDRVESEFPGNDAMINPLPARDQCSCDNEPSDVDLLLQEIEYELSLKWEQAVDLEMDSGYDTQCCSDVSSIGNSHSNSFNPENEAEFMDSEPGYLCEPPSGESEVLTPPGGDIIVSGSHLSSHQPSGGQILSRSATAMPLCETSESTSSKVRLKRFAEQTPHSGSNARSEPPSGKILTCTKSQIPLHSTGCVTPPSLNRMQSVEIIEQPPGGTSESVGNSSGDLKYVKLKHFPEHISKEIAMSTPSVPFSRLKWFPSQEGANEKFKDLQQLQVACC